MFPNRKRPPVWGSHIVDNGNVGCPRVVQDVEFDECLACPSFRSYSTDQGVTYLICRPPRRLDAAGF